MTVNMNVFDKKFIAQLSKQKNEPEWISELRLKAYDLYKEFPLPYVEKTKIDKWNIDRFEPFIEENKVENIDELPEEVKSLLEVNPEERNVLVQKNSSVIFYQLSKKLADQGVIFTDLDYAIQEYPDLIKKYFLKNISLNDKLIALHTALWSGGVFLYIPKNVEVEFPIQAMYLASESGLLPHTIIVAEANSSVTYVDQHFSIDSKLSTVHNNVAEVYVEEGARVRFASIHNLSKEIYDYTYRYAEVGRDGKMEWIIGDMNAGNSLSGTTSILKSPGSVAETKSIYVGTGNQKSNFTVKVVHEGEHTESNILSRGVLLDKSTGIFNGITEMKKGAKKSNAEQVEKILMLSDSARGDANPILLIDEHDLMAGHAASAGPVDQNDMFYLLSRGIPREEAERLIIHGFLAPVVSRIPIEGMKEQLEQLIERKLER